MKNTLYSTACFSEYTRHHTAFAIDIMMTQGKTENKHQNTERTGSDAERKIYFASRHVLVSIHVATRPLRLTLR